MSKLVGLLVLVVVCAYGLHWAYELVQPLLWLVPVVGLLIGVYVAVRAYRRRF